jgi:hypothetical protein
MNERGSISCQVVKLEEQKRELEDENRTLRAEIEKFKQASMAK